MDRLSNQPVSIAAASPRTMSPRPARLVNAASETTSAARAGVSTTASVVRSERTMRSPLMTIAPGHDSKVNERALTDISRPSELNGIFLLVRRHDDRPLNGLQA